MAYEMIARYTNNGDLIKKINEDFETAEEVLTFANEILNQTVWLDRLIVVFDEKTWREVYKATATANPDSFIKIHHNDLI